ncbi:MAG TPA: glutathione S-transferase family protein [Candidatus Sulfotelmatobacter sp.]|jgi:glutathione S-transferase|nr:glutathione S-transferase family protein [Candidatus Sulfotelmatobacter sp.]
MLELRQFPLFRGVNLSPFCLKVEAYLRLTGLPFRIVTGQSFRAPKGKLPVLVDDGLVISDSGDIIAYLERTRGAPLDGGLTPEQAALGHAVIRMLDESLYFAIVYDRWLVDANWRVLMAELLRKAPLPIRWIVPRLIRRKIRRDLMGQGYGRHSWEQACARGAADIAAVAALLGEKAFLLRDRPSVADVALYASLTGLMSAGFGGPLVEAVGGRPNLLAFLDRMDALIRR